VKTYQTVTGHSVSSGDVAWIKKMADALPIALRPVWKNREIGTMTTPCGERFSFEFSYRPETQGSLPGCGLHLGYVFLSDMPEIPALREVISLNGVQVKVRTVKTSSGETFPCGSDWCSVAHVRHEYWIRIEEVDGR
jgi:hypothetical protein